MPRRAIRRLVRLWLDPERMRFRRRFPVVVRIGGLLFTVAGGGAAIATMLDPSHGPGQTLILLVCFVLPGVTLAFGTAGVVVDRRSRQVIQWRGLRLPLLLDLPLWHRVYALDDYRVVVFTTEVWWQGERGGGTTVYPVYLYGSHQLLGEDGETSPAEHLLLEGPLWYSSSRRRAERVADFLGLGVVDQASGGEPAYRPAGTLDDSLRLSWRSTGELSPQRPENARTGYVLEGHEGVFEIPARGLSIRTAVGVSLATATPLALLLIPGAPYQVSLGLALAVALNILLWVVVPRLVWDRVMVSPLGLRLERRSLLGWRSVELAGEEVEEIVLAHPRVRSMARIGYGGSVIGVRSDRRVVEVGFGLDGHEMEWLRASLKDHLLGIAAYQEPPQ
jgi:hypothetical protein